MSSRGFTLVELMISVGILTLIATSTVFVMRRTREREELQTAGRLLVSDLRDVQARALQARNALTCDTVGLEKKICEPENKSPILCTGPCTVLPPPRYGVALAVFQDAYDLFADVNGEDWRLTSDAEQVARRGLNPLGGNRVTISRIETELGIIGTSNLAAGRQSGAMRIEACGDPGLPACAPTEPKWLKITLRHAVSNDTIAVEVNALTGRVSIQ